MVVAVTKIFADLLERTGSLAADENPYDYFRKEIHDLTIYQMSDAWYRSIDADIALLAISLVCYAATLVIRHRSGGLWFFKTVETGSGSLLVPNTVTMFSALSIGSAIINIPALSVMRAGYKETIRVDVYTWLQPLQWPLTIFVVISELHGISVFLYMMQAGTSTPHLHGWKIRPAMVTSAFALLYFLSFVSISVPFAVAASNYPTNYAEPFLNAVDAKARSWSTGQPFAFDASWIMLATTMTDRGTAGVTSNRAAWLSLFANVILVTALFLPVGFLYIKTISGRIRLVQNTREAETNQSREAKRLKSAYLLMLLELAILLVCAIAYSIVLAQWSIHYNTIIADQTAINITWGILYCIFPIVSFSISVTLLWRAIQGAHDQGKAGSLLDKTSRSSNRKSARVFGENASTTVGAIEYRVEEYVEMDPTKSVTEDKEARFWRS